jgi:hypothetical protein
MIPSGSSWVRASCIAAMLVIIASVPAAAAGPVEHVRESAQHEIKVAYYPDDICGPRGGWTTYSLTWHYQVTDLGDSVHVGYVETGAYSANYDDPALEDTTGQFTEAIHFNLTRGGTATYTEQFHDFLGTIQIWVHITIAEQNGIVRLDRSVLKVTGCP